MPIVIKIVHLYFVHTCLFLVRGSLILAVPMLDINIAINSLASLKATSTAGLTTTGFLKIILRLIRVSFISFNTSCISCKKSALDSAAYSFFISHFQLTPPTLLCLNFYTELLQPNARVLLFRFPLNRQWCDLPLKYDRRRVRKGLIYPSRFLIN